METQINIKTSWSEVNLREYLQIAEIEQKYSDRPLATLVKMLEVLSDTTEEVLLDMDTDSLQSLVAQVGYLNEQPVPHEGVDFEIDNVKYGIVDMSSLTAGEVISIEQLLITHQGDKGFAVLPPQLAILIRPIIGGEIEKFNVESLKAREELFMEKLTVPFFMGLAKSSIDILNK